MTDQDRDKETKLIVSLAALDSCAELFEGHAYRMTRLSVETALRRTIEASESFCSQFSRSAKVLKRLAKRLKLKQIKRIEREANS